MPNIVSIFSDAVIRREYTAGSGIHKRLSRPILSVAIISDSTLVSVHIGFKISKAHEGICYAVSCIDKVIGNMREILTADRTLKTVNNAFENR